VSHEPLRALLWDVTSRRGRNSATGSSHKAFSGSSLYFEIINSKSWKELWSPTKSIYPSPSCSGSQEIPRVVEHEGSLHFHLDCILSQINPFHIFTPYLFKIRFNVTLPPPSINCLCLFRKRMSNSVSAKGRLKMRRWLSRPSHGWRKSRPPDFTNSKLKLKIYFSFHHFPTSAHKYEFK
jgi:hypothetical protein